ncbi:MAG: hypothetical protein CMF62_00790 [Magnetococcales bacterium]|nr:hypothetical protein [Magnetococcales bacterium]
MGCVASSNKIHSLKNVFVYCSPGTVNNFQQLLGIFNEGTFLFKKEHNLDKDNQQISIVSKERYIKEIGADKNLLKILPTKEKLKTIYEILATSEKVQICYYPISFVSMKTKIKHYILTDIEKITTATGNKKIKRSLKRCGNSGSSKTRTSLEDIFDDVRLDHSGRSKSSKHTKSLYKHKNLGSFNSGYSDLTGMISDDGYEETVIVLRTPKKPSKMKNKKNNPTEMTLESGVQLSVFQKPWPKSTPARPQSDRSIIKDNFFDFEEVDDEDNDNISPIKRKKPKGLSIEVPK